jgi:hypothetical protein
MHHKTIKKALLIIAFCTLATFIALYAGGRISSPAEKLGFYSAVLASGALAVSLLMQLKKTA